MEVIYTRISPASFDHLPIEIAVMYDGYSVSVDGQHCGSLLHAPPHYRGAPFRARRIVMLAHGLDAVREPNDFELQCFQVRYHSLAASGFMVSLAASV